MNHRLVFACFFAIVVSLVCGSCSSGSLDSEDLSGEMKIIKEQLQGIKQVGLTIETISNKSNRLSVSLSNGNALLINKSLINEVTIGIDGFWHLNGVKSTFSTEKCSGHDVLKSKYSSGSLQKGVTLGVVEDYTEWGFYFQDEDSIVLKKTLYSYDADKIMRGVNHRGFSYQVPENTLPAFRMSRLQGFKYVETDVRFTSDGIPVLLHDKTIDRTSDGSGNISDLSFDYVRSLDFGKWKSKDFQGTVIPTLNDFLDLCEAIGLEPNIELKEGTKDQITAIVKDVMIRGLTEKATFTSFSRPLLSYVLEVNPYARLGYLCNKVSSTVIADALSLKRDSNEVYIGASDYSEEAVSLCQAASLPLAIWVLDSEDKILSLPSYVSSVTSNRLHAGRVLYNYKTKTE